MSNSSANILRVGTVAPERAAEPPQIPDHELIRPIGHGSYGEVWLARSVTGSYRAVKIVFRRSFDHVRPFEREFEGIRKFEPISRTHESQVNILHVGRMETYFFYVMELADDIETGPQVHPESYSPKTLRTEFLRRGALPVGECVEIALCLSTALEHLHKHGLVHRDIKPSNIIFVNGVPKLADIGLVAAVDATRSFVGTEGFFPPEGPGTPRADIYSLGKVLYEISTGMDRQDFPDLPTSLVEQPGREAFMEFNAIVAKSCRADANQRYLSARELHGELVLLQTGKSVRRVRLLEKQIRKITHIGIAAAIAGGILALAFLFQRQQTAKARALASENQRLATESRHHVLRMQSANGTRALEAGDSIGAALWFAENLKLSKDDPVLERLNRLRLEWILHEYPRIEHMFMHRERANTASFNRDGTRVVTASKDGTAQVWDTQTGKQIGPPLKHEAEVWRANFSADGQIVVSSGRDGTARLWKAATGEPICPPLRHANAVTAACFNPAGDRVLTASWDGTAQVWDPATGLPMLPAFKHNGPVKRGEWTPDGKRIVTGSTDRTAKIWNAETGELLHTLRHSYSVDSIDISADGKRLLTATGDTGGGRCSQGFVWEIETGKLLLETSRNVGGLQYARFSPDQRAIVLGSTPLGVHNAITGNAMFTPLAQGQINFIAFSPDGATAATASELNGSVFIWDIQSGKNIFSPLRHGSFVRHVEFSSDGQRLLTSGDDGVVRLWSLVTSPARTATLRHEESVFHSSFNADGTRIVTAGRDGKARVWDATSGHLAFPPIENPHPIEHAVFSGNGQRLLVSPRNTGWLDTDRRPWSTLSVWDPMTGQRIGPVISHPPSIFAAAISPDGRFVASASENGTIQIWDVESGKPVGTILEQGQRVRVLDFSPDGRSLLILPDSDTVTLWDWQSARTIPPPLKHSSGIRHATYSPDGKRIATTGYDQAGRIWDAITGAALTESFKHHGVIHYAAWSPDSRWIATCGASPRVRIWDGNTGQLALPPLEHGRDISHAAFHPDGTMLLTAARDRTARIWDLASGEQVIPPLLHRAGVMQGTFNRQGTAFATACLDGNARIWSFPKSDLSSEDLNKLAHLVSGQSSDRPGVFLAENPQKLQDDLKLLRDRYPLHFAVSQEQVLDWHRAEADNAEDNRRWTAMAWNLDALLRTKSDDVQLLKRRSAARAELKQWKLAQADLSKVIALGHNSQENLVQLLIASWREGDREKCREICGLLIQNARNSDDAEIKGFVSGYISLFPGLLDNYDGPIAMIEQAIQHDPTNREHHERLFALLYRAGLIDKAAEQLRTVMARSKDPRNSPYFLYFRAMLFHRQGNATAARGALVTANRSHTEFVQDRLENNLPWHILEGWELLREEAKSLLEEK